MKLELMHVCAKDFFQIGGYVQTKVNSLSGKESCTCKGFRTHHRCKHMDKAKSMICGYHEANDGPPIRKNVCPKCGSGTILVKYCTEVS